MTPISLEIPESMLAVFLQYWNDDRAERGQPTTTDPTEALMAILSGRFAAIIDAHTAAWRTKAYETYGAADATPPAWDTCPAQINLHLAPA